ncbi:MAG: adenylate/guanylate cyclase domain-containing protein, partial [Rhodospirillaceae bacterium]|nr:adenylate/guanylate cyclase domain-containing protein [Rhodospirillaceae bacterium]
LYEVYVPIMDATGDLLAIFELYEKPEALNTLLGNAMITAALPSALLFAILVIGLFWMVSRAQADLNRHNARLRQLQDQLSSLVSDSAVAAAQQAGEGGELPVQRRVETIFYSDIRDFTSYSEANSPENVIGFLNEIMEIQIGAIRDAGGDVDKLIGDAVLARFDGSDAERLAMETASLIHQRISDADLPRRVGIGIFTGEVIAGAVGSAARHDYTVIGDTVNVAARLCTEAGTEETVVDLGTARRSQMEDLGDESKITVKGRDEPLVIYRRR